MGQRHQAFVIARVRPHGPPNAAPKYRCIAAFHHQWCYGSLPLNAARRFITLVKQPENAEIVGAELRSMSGKYGDHWEAKPPHMPGVPCKFISFLLGISFSVGLGSFMPNEAYVDGPHYSHNLLDAKMDSGDGDNNDGITVFDITEPESPAYCFVSISGLESAVKVPGSVPLSAAQYLRAYYPKPTPEELNNEDNRLRDEYMEKTIASLEGEKMVTLRMLAEAWPSEYEEPDGSDEASPPSETTSIALTVGDSALPSLVNMTFREGVVQAVENDRADEIEKIVLFPDKAPLVGQILREFTPFPSAGMPYLLHIASGSTSTLDLSEFQPSSEQIVEVISACKNLESLNLSFNPAVTSDTVRGVLTTVPGLKRLVLMECPSLGEADLCDLLRSEPELFRNLEALMHPLFLIEGHRHELPNTFAMWQQYTRVGGSFKWSCSMAVATPRRIVQCLTDYFQSIQASTVTDNLVLNVNFLNAVVTGSAREPDQKWDTRSVLSVPQMATRSFAGEGWLFLIHNTPLVPALQHRLGFVRRVPASPESAPPTESQALQSPVQTDTSSNDNSDSIAHESEGHASGSILESGESLSHESTTEETGPGVSDEPNLVTEIHDLRSFLSIFSKGRPQVSEAAIVRLETLISSLDERLGVVTLSQKDVAAMKIYS
ncbi:hypothetical protein AcV5_000482 [Taiwanofungus camphoratus]|nr:hypothetical protein AcW2_006891 [Antrodia cinnamomea]KAI0938920.1 hypothetical protein AcV5_000482 [Antrodia cinnamomea]KAI0951835.1 hypothetical protein AcV7_007823 [Antrodia cinnamomea]